MVPEGPIDADWAFARYEAARARLPAMPPRAAGSRRLPDLSGLLGEVDLFLLDGFGVLNVGGTAIPGAVGRVAQMRAAGARVLVLTNAATQPPSAAVAKYAALGFDFAEAEIVSSRTVAAAALPGHPPGLRWGVATASLAGWPGAAEPLGLDPAAYDRADGFALLSGDAWGPGPQALLERALARRARPLVVANPDIVAPREGGLTLEPGYWAHLAADRAGARPTFYGKPFGNAFAAAFARLGPDLPPLSRIAMVGDTLHTDVLDGAAEGVRTVLVARHGLFAGKDVWPTSRAAGSCPTSSWKPHRDGATSRRPRSLQEVA